MLYYNHSSADSLKSLRSSIKGLSRNEANQRLAQYGPNAIKLKGEPLWRIIIEPFASVFMLVLFVAAGVSLLHEALFDAVIVLAVIAVSAIIYYVQRFSTARIIRALQKHSAQQVDVIRGDKTITVPAEALVPGDIVQLDEGDKVPADLRIITADNLRADESVLTGESVPVSKDAATLRGTKEVYEQTNMLFQGAFVVSGHTTAVVVETGNTTEFGRIANLTKKGTGATSPVQKKIDKLLQAIIAVVAGLSVIAFVLSLLRGIELAEALQFVLALAVSAVPESLPVAISVILVLGMRRMAARKALVRSMHAIETVGVITTIATDKTGTLTKNKLSVQEVWQPASVSHHLPTMAHRSINHHGDTARDPLDIAMIEYTNAEATVQFRGEARHTLPFDQGFAMSGNVWHHNGTLDLIVKGAPEKIFARASLNKQALQEANEALHRLTGQGYRVIALGTRRLNAPVTSFMELKSSHTLEFVGLLAVADTLRPSARKAISVAQAAGVSVRMITGDHFETAYHIGRQLHLVKDRADVFDSLLIDDLTPSQLKKRILAATVFSRVTPENKLRILTILKEKEIIAMTGDGVNDVPALAGANVGVAMGSGSQIARDAGDIILLNDDFASLVRAMREGRIIFSNIRRILYNLLSANSGQVLVSLGALIVGAPVPLAAVQILWINLVTETSLVIPLGLEPGEKTVMKRKPVSPKAPIFTRDIVIRMILVALTMATVTLGIYALFTQTHGLLAAQTLAFNALVVMQWANAFNARSTYESAFSRLKVWNGAFYLGLSVAVVLQVLVMFGPLGDFLHVNDVALQDVVLTSVVSFALIIAVAEIHKFIGRRANI